MIILLFIVHLLIALALIGVVMLQKSEGGALGMGGGGMSGFMTGRSTANLLTRTTAILGAAFFATSILLVSAQPIRPCAALDHRPGRRRCRRRRCCRTCRRIRPRPPAHAPPPAIPDRRPSRAPRWRADAFGAAPVDAALIASEQACRSRDDAIALPAPGIAMGSSLAIH